jgi:hypothetical protein
MCSYFIMLTLTDLSSCLKKAESMTITIFLLHLELHRPLPLKTGRATYSTSKKHRKGEKRTLMDPRARGRYWRMEIRRRQLSTLSVFHRKSKLESVVSGSLKNINGQYIKKGRVENLLYVQRYMSQPRPTESYWNGPF